MEAFPPRFRAHGRLGEGASGIVYAARDTVLGTDVAVKVLRRASPEGVARFKGEARALAELAHENLVEVQGLYEHDGRWFLVMERVRGTDALSSCRRRVEATDRRAAASTVTVSSDNDPSPLSSSVGASNALASPAPPGAVDFEQVRRVFGQLLSALAALHSAGMIHRDIKPSNVLVEECGRVVVLDLGLAVALGEAELGGFAGTAAYAAPEQLAGEALDERCDVYAAGTMLYEILTGRLPYRMEDGGLLAMRKRQWDPAPVTEFSPAVPADLARLCTVMLTREPGKRPDAHAVWLETVRGGGGAARRPARSTFIGRTDALASLEGLRARARAGHPAAVIVSGPPGIGKSTLVRRFLDQEATREVIVLEGKCYPHERVAFRGFDSIVDGIARRRAVDPAVRAALAEVEGLDAVHPLFPALSPPPDVARLPATEQDARELRAAAFAALARCFDALSRRMPVVVYLDDVQWLDDDGFELVASVFGRDQRGSSLFIATARLSGGRDEAVGRMRAAFPTATEIELGPLAEDECVTLVEKLRRFDGATGERDRALTLARDSGGVPLVLRELLSSSDDASAPAPDFASVLSRRVDSLTASARDLLSVLAVSGRPAPRDLLFSAWGGELSEGLRALRALRVERLVRTVELGESDGVDVVHDRVREVVIERLDPAVRRGLHARLAKALEAATGADPGDLVRHLAEAGHLARAGEIARGAAVRAMSVLAFEHAAELLRLAAKADGTDGGEELALALAAAGRGCEAADILLRLAETAPGVTRGSYLQKAAEQLLTSGEVERGMSALESVLDEVDESLASTRIGAVAGIAVRKLQSAMPTLAPVRASERDRVRRRFDALRTVGFGLGMIDNLAAAHCHAKAFVLAQRLGDARPVGEALATEAIFRGSTSTRGRRSARELVERARAVAKADPDGSVAAWAEAADAVLTAFDEISDETIDRLERAEQAFHGGMTCARWAKSSLYLIRALSLRLAGSFRRVVRVVGEGIRDARARRDRYLEVTLLRGGTIAHLAAGDPAGARADLARATWVPRSVGVHVQHWLEIEAESEIALYERSSRDALERHVRAVRSARRTLLGRLQRVRMVALGLEGRLRLAQAAQEERGALARVEALARGLDREELGLASAQAELLRAGAAAVADAAGVPGASGRSRTHLERVVELGDRHGLRVLAACARLRLARVAPSRALALDGAAEAFFVEEGVAKPRAILDIYAPGWEVRTE